MPSSLAYSGTRSFNENARSLNLTRMGTDDKSMDDSRPKNEDVFLNIARADSGRRDSIGRSDFRRSRLGYSTQSLRSPTSEQTPSPDQRYSNPDPLLAQYDSPTIPYSSHTPASAHPLDEPGRFRYSSLGTGSRSTVGVPRSRFSRTSPETSPRTPSVDERRASMHDPRHRHSGISTIRGSRQPSTSEVTERARADTERSRVDGTESTLSTTAPSTVWDELDELKDRIKKLELTGKLPPSSSAAMYSPSTERPRTANTAMTTISSSPKYHRKASVSGADTDSSYNSQVQPILQSALSKAKLVLSGEVYTSLEATITDALTLTTALGANATQLANMSAVNGGYTSPDRHARRKADSVCRSLTELCLALTDEQLKNHRPSSSRETGGHSQLSNGTEPNPRMSVPSYQRQATQEPEGLERRHSTTRISSRLDARRASLVNTSPGNLAEIKQSPNRSPGIPTPSTRLNRASTSLRSRRLTLGEENSETDSPHSRSVSRANTEIGIPLSTPGIPQRQRFSHNRTISRSISGAQPDQANIGISPRSPQYQPQHQPSQVPQPTSQTPTPRTPTLSSNLSFRRSYMSPATYTPATARSNIQAGSRRYGLTPSFSSNNVQASDENSRLPLESSQTRISAPSTKTAASYTPIQQQRLRTNSLGARRFGLRNRAPTTPNNNINLDDSID
ncbi:unnamed protein product [Penicillium salamii]|uniref:LPXTG-motif cell wall anchor domain protein n=1 Tax=Penicillium salamii TaxID=1612424 RepID=A0A9W4IHL0_9EURO|nr:unnamed protein product [Penicillium salamii]CAG8106309.1 unnamed protein product [Penicillium salamii]CAG8283591.1 unnamed protein product [Penicillium salamii]CAG8302044.1 unnamed protein product [Penicillium salamii]CAG8385413.1 unnamed protein product [Penicillium salamii]